jgi:hypothetical protein
MVFSPARLQLVGSPAVWRHRLVAAVTVVGWLMIAALIASLYVGHSPSPYGTCLAPNGRPVSCTLLHH